MFYKIELNQIYTIIMLIKSQADEKIDVSTISLVEVIVIDFKVERYGKNERHS